MTGRGCKSSVEEEDSCFPGLDLSLSGEETQLPMLPSSLLDEFEWREVRGDCGSPAWEKMCVDMLCRPRNSTRLLPSPAAIAAFIVRSGRDGWNMVGCGGWCRVSIFQMVAGR
jgi:hypothetical protein